jgi:hypothetical protein
MDVISKSAQSICYAGSGKGNVNPLSKGGGKNGQHDGLRTSLRRMRSDMRDAVPHAQSVSASTPHTAHHCAAWRSHEDRSISGPCINHVEDEFPTPI